MDNILLKLDARPGGMTDAELAQGTGKLHQQINQRCRQMAAAGLISRDRTGGVIVNRIAAGGQQGSRQPAAASAQVSAAGRAWSWEGNVQATLCRWLVHEGWSLTQVVDTASKQQGTDIVAERAGSRMHVEVKGFPSTSYADPRRAGETKPTAPALQANHWYAGRSLRCFGFARSTRTKERRWRSQKRRSIAGCLVRPRTQSALCGSTCSWSPRTAR
jgi:hypothetical protein